MSRDPRELFEEGTAGDRVGWMELQLRRARDKVSQLEAIVAESNRQIRNFTERVNEMEASIQSFTTQIELTRQVHLVIGRLKEQLTKVEESQDVVVRQMRDAGKLREARAKADLQERALLMKRIEELERHVQAFDSRVSRNTDYERKANERMDLLQRDLEGSRRDLASEGERTRVQLERFRRLEEQMTQFGELRSSAQDLLHKAEVREVEQARADGRIAELEQQIEEMRRSLPAISDRAGKVENTMGGFVERMAAVEGVVDEGRKGLLERLLRFAETQEQLRRRQIDDLQREIRELRRYSARLRED
ncbi:MAG: hypothetical protein GEU28_07860 [Dehalococcoidia bacterium]|nr:hypothetical protein [Dehalococcoidia bacterium]